MKRLVLVLGDQLSAGLSALAAADKAHDLIVMAEVADETGYVPHHPRKIALVLSAMASSPFSQIMTWGSNWPYYVAWQARGFR